MVTSPSRLESRLSAPGDLMWAVVPVKMLSEAKGRLAGRLESSDRQALALAMLGDVLEVLSAVRGLAGVLVVTHDAEAAAEARAHAASVLAEDGTAGLNAALEQAAAQLATLGARGMVVVPADVPSVLAAELETVVVGHEDGAPKVSIVSDRHGRGTNCLACSPPDLCTFRFGEGSFQRHQAGAREVGLELVILHLPGLELDVDTEEDLDLARGRELGLRTRRLLSRQSVEQKSPEPSLGVLG